MTIKNRMKMKPFVKLLIISLIMSCSGFASVQGTEKSEAELKAILDRLQPEFNSTVTVFDLNAWSGVLRKYPDLNKITTDAVSYKKAALELISEPQEIDRSELSPWHHRSGLLIVAMSGLPPDQYLDFASQIVERIEKKELNLPEDDLSFLILPKVNNTGLFEYNYKDPLVRDLLGRIKFLRLAAMPLKNVEERKRAIDTIDRILSGEMRTSRERTRKNYPNEYPNNILPPITAFQMAHDSANADAMPMPDRNTPELATQSASKPSPTITPVAKPLSEPSSNISLIVGILLLLAVAGFVFYRRKS